MMVWSTLWQMVRTRSGKGKYDEVTESSNNRRGAFRPPVPSPLHRRLQWALSNYWLQSISLCRDWSKVLSVRQDNHSTSSSLKSPPILTSWQPDLQSLLRQQTRLTLTTGFTWLSQNLDCFTVLSFRRHYMQHNSSVAPQVHGGHVYYHYLGQSLSVVGWVLQSILWALPSSWNHAPQPMGVSGSITRGRQCVWVHQKV
jgi:hypothetical protein